MKVVVVSGPTASGKTDIAIELARTFGGEIINFDSLLLYREITIGTAKPAAEERKKVPHHMVDVRSIRDSMNAADYAREAYPIAEKLLRENKVVYLVGGSGFYLQALLKGMYNSPSTPTQIQKQSDDLYRDQGIGPFLEVLKVHDQKSFARYHENDHYRIRRAVEHWWTTGFPLSLAREDKDKKNQELQKASVHDWDIIHIYLNIPRDEHFEIIQKRTDRMLAGGLIEEVQNLLREGFTGLEKPLQSIGYKETLDYLFGIHKSLAECRERINISTRQLAKSQRTWFNRDQFKRAFHPLSEKEQLFHAVKTHLK